jgi:rhodanese-related sulfurtransferase
MHRTASRTIGLVLLALLIAVVAACGGGGASITKVDAASAVDMLKTRVVIDVRTPDEFAAGHIAGAQNIDVEAADFGSRIATLDPKGAYVVYCRTGRRSAIAAEQLASAGFKDIVDAGGFDALVAAGAPAE